MARTAIRTATCTFPNGGCKQQIDVVKIWDLDDPSKRGFMPLDRTDYARDDTRATWALTTVGQPKARALRKGEEPLADEIRRMPHQATCTARAGRSEEPTSQAPRTPAPRQSRIDLDTRPAAGLITEAPTETLDDALADLDSMIGLDAVKLVVRQQIALQQIAELRAKAGLPAATVSRHLVFTGNPGTGKTTVARIIGRIYRALGVLSRGHFVEADRRAMVGQYVGHTAEKTGKLIEEALGGVLFIDEAYALAPPLADYQRDFGSEAIDTLVAAMENHRDDLAVIVAGYESEMDRFVNANPGLASRFRTVITFHDYTDDELTEVFVHLAEHAAYVVPPQTRAAITPILANEPRGRGFGNGRCARNLLEAAITHQAVRLSTATTATREDLQALLPEDLTGEAHP